jgi:hypothetical protein
MSDEGMSGKAQEAAGQAQQKAQDATANGQNMVREQVDQRSTEAGEKVSGTASDLRSIGEELRKQGKETPAKLADNAAERTERVGNYLTNSDGDKLLDDIEDFGRRRPWVVLGGGVVVGLAAARFLRASSGSRYQGRTGVQGPTPQVRRGPMQAGPLSAPEPLGTPSGVPREPQIPVTPNTASGR